MHKGVVNVSMNIIKTAENFLKKNEDDKNKIEDEL